MRRKFYIRAERPQKKISNRELNPDHRKLIQLSTTNLFHCHKPATGFLNLSTSKHLSFGKEDPTSMNEEMTAEIYAGSWSKVETLFRDIKKRNFHFLKIKFLLWTCLFKYNSLILLMDTSKFHFQIFQFWMRIGIAFQNSDVQSLAPSSVLKTILSVTSFQSIIFIYSF